MSSRHLNPYIAYRAHLGPMVLDVPGYELADVLADVEPLIANS